MDPKQISRLAKLLRDNGDKVLDSQFTFTASGHLIRALNDSFTLIADQNELCSPMSFQVVKPNNSKSEVFRDLQLVHDFVQKTLSLCITQYPTDEHFEGSIDIGKFRNLRHLEIQKMNVKQVVGIQALRAQLHQITCIRSLSSVEDIITNCGGDNCNGFVWNELKVADFSYNNLRSVDSSLEFAQWLQVLNLSHNQLVSIDAVKWLPNLKVLNLSFNRLTNVPTLHAEAPRRLQVLTLNNNFVEDLFGLSRLDALNELDLADNCLLDHSLLLPICNLVSLRYLNLSGNPLSCHPNHRHLSARHLNKNATSMKFFLDNEILSRSEKADVSGCQNYNIMISRSSYNQSSGLSTPTRSSHNQTPASSVGSTRSFHLTGSISNENPLCTVGKQKKTKIRTVEIENINPSIQATSYKKIENRQIPEGSKDHLETKRQIDELRDKFGSGWLQNENVHMVQSVLGISTISSPILNRISSQQLFDDFLVDLNRPVNATEENNMSRSIPALSSTPKNYTVSCGDGNYVAALEPINSSSTVYESVITADSDNVATFYASVSNDNTDPNMDDIYAIEHNESDVSEPDETEVTYIVHQSDVNDEVFLAVSENFIKERDILSRRTKTKWSLKILESCERIKSDKIRINFDTVKKDRKERIYTVEEGLCQELERYLRKILSKRLLCEMNQSLYKCVKCSTQFSRENKYKKTCSDVCPECGSIFVVELQEVHSPSNIHSKYEELPVVVNNIPMSSKTLSEYPVGKQTLPSCTVANIMIDTTGQPRTGEKYIIEESASNSSIGSAGSLNESSSCSKITQSEDSFDSNRSVAGSSTNERDLDFSMNRNGESDIEILSNPSQSSIEVLEHAYASRKTSEERRISCVPSLDTIQDNSYNSASVLPPYMNKEVSIASDVGSIENSRLRDSMQFFNTDCGDGLSELDRKISLAHVNLTESSSSGSVTDSVCTAYEHEHDKSSTTINMLDRKTPLKQTKQSTETKKDESLISTMFGGLFQSTNILMSRSSKPQDTHIACEKFTFSYTDFSDADHRLKLYLYQNLFEDSNENFKWLVKGKICKEPFKSVFDGIMVMSTTRLYIMEIYGPENDDITKWLRRVSSVTVDRIAMVEMLPWKLGISLAIKSSNTFFLLLQDILRTDSLLLFFANNPLPDDCTLHHQISENLLKKISDFANAEPLKMISILNKCEITSDDIQKNFMPAGFFATDTHFFVTTSNFYWLQDDLSANIELGHVQSMSNLIEIDRLEKNIFLMNFLDEDQDKYEQWQCHFETEDNANSYLSAIGQSWEKLFGVPLASN